MKRRRRIYFRKTYKYTGGPLGEYLAVTDGYIIKQISNICTKYDDIQINSIKLKDNIFSDLSHITVRASKKDFNKFCIDFCAELSGYIENIKF